MIWTQDAARVIFIGVGATAVMDLWLLLLRWLGVPTANFALIGRWVGHLARGRFAHDAIAKAPPIAGELGLGWLAHYLVGIAFAGLLVALHGTTWIAQPSYLPALAVGVGTVLVPLGVIQPAMGAGFAGSRTPSPLRNGLRSLANHAVFGVGLYVAAAALAHVSA